jgi:ELWxxDGT repeat protein
LLVTTLVSATDETGNTDLWSSDGTITNTVKISPPEGSTTGMVPSEFHIFNGRLYFTAYDSDEKSALWRSDGTNNGTVPIVPLSPYVLASNATDLFFVADNPANNDATSIWKSDGTAENTMLVTALPENALALSSAMLGNQYIVNLRIAGGERELWVSDGTAEGTRLVKDIRPDGDDQVKDLYVLGDTLYLPPTTAFTALSCGSPTALPQAPCASSLSRATRYRMSSAPPQSATPSLCMPKMASMALNSGNLTALPMAPRW